MNKQEFSDKRNLLGIALMDVMEYTQRGWVLTQAEKPDFGQVHNYLKLAEDLANGVMLMQTGSYTTMGLNIRDVQRAISTGYFPFEGKAQIDVDVDLAEEVYALNRPLITTFTHAMVRESLSRIQGNDGLVSITVRDFKGDIDSKNPNIVEYSGLWGARALNKEGVDSVVFTVEDNGTVLPTNAKMNAAKYIKGKMYDGDPDKGLDMFVTRMAAYFMGESALLITSEPGKTVKTLYHPGTKRD